MRCYHLHITIYNLYYLILHKWLSIVPHPKLLGLVLVLEVRQDGVPGQVHQVHIEHPELEGDQSKVDHLEGGPQEAVTEVHLEELVLEPPPCLGWSLGLHDGDAIKEGGVNKDRDNSLVTENLLCSTGDGFTRNVSVKIDVKIMPGTPMEQPHQQHFPTSVPVIRS